jgi:hypothetical protein
MATYRFTVTFAVEPSPVVSITPTYVQVEAEEINLITFNLCGPAGAEFPSTPIQWLQGDPVEPIDLPPWFVMHRHDAQHFALWDFNSAPEAKDHRFQVYVFFNGQTYTHDPSIINEPPVG